MDWYEDDEKESQSKRNWRISELLAADCEKVWLQAGWEDTMQKWYDWPCEMKKKDEAKKMEVEHRTLVSRMIKSADGSAGLLHKITMPTTWRGGVQVLKKEEEDAKPMARCEEEEEWAKHWQCDTKVQNPKDKPWRNEELKSLEEEMPRLLSAMACIPKFG